MKGELLGEESEDNVWDAILNLQDAVAGLKGEGDPNYSEDSGTSSDSIEDFTVMITADKVEPKPATEVRGKEAKDFFVKEALSEEDDEGTPADGDRVKTVKAITGTSADEDRVKCTSAAEDRVKAVKATTCTSADEDHVKAVKAVTCTSVDEDRVKSTSADEDRVKAVKAATCTSADEDRVKCTSAAEDRVKVPNKPINLDEAVAYDAAGQAVTKPTFLTQKRH